jgi:hypothetical protein
VGGCVATTLGHYRGVVQGTPGYRSIVATPGLCAVAPTNVREAGNHTSSASPICRPMLLVSVHSSELPRFYPSAYPLLCQRSRPVPPLPLPPTAALPAATSPALRQWGEARRRTPAGCPLAAAGQPEGPSQTHAAANCSTANTGGHVGVCARMCVTTDAYDSNAKSQGHKSLGGRQCWGVVMQAPSCRTGCWLCWRQTAGAQLTQYIPCGESEHRPFQQHSALLRCSWNDFPVTAPLSLVACIPDVWHIE